MEFRFKLALQLGMTVADLSDRLTAAEEAHWIAYYRINPFGDERADVRSAQICQLLYNIHAPKGKKSEVADFMPYRKKKPAQTTAQDIRNNFESFITAQRKKGKQ